MPRDADSAARFEWWRSHRWHYNRGLIIAGILAFVCYITVAWTAVARVHPGVEVTVFTTAFQGIAYAIAIGLANIFYFLGPLSERIIRPRDPVHYRGIAYFLGYWFSLLLPFAIPTLLLYAALFHPEQFREIEP